MTRLLGRIDITALGALILLALAAPSAAYAQAQPKALGEAAPIVEVLVMTRGPEIFARFGHTSLLVTPVRGRALIYNFGFTVFDSGLAWRFLRGRARFWVELSTIPRTKAYYLPEGRAIYRYRLRLSDAQARTVDRLLRQNRLPKNRYYFYDHLTDNCASRVRDVVNSALGDRIRKRFGKLPAGKTYRQLTREGFADSPAVLFGIELVIGRLTDRPISRWELGYLPDELVHLLRAARADDGGPLLAPRITMIPRRVPRPGVGKSPLVGVYLVVALAALLALAASGALLLRRRERRLSGLLLLLPTLVFGLVALLIWSIVAVASGMPALRYNELALIFWPTDWLLLGSAIRWMRGRFAFGRLMRTYILVRCIALALVLVGHATTLLYQQPRAWLLVGLAVWVPLFLARRDALDVERPEPARKEDSA
ncbi:MAG: DUF4105 domain-containing protein [Myxococcales bacterium]|nr:DUF4105 domain-containing protein [Myxococcales bacterium]